MSFSSEVKEELSRQLTSARHCRMAELSAIIAASARIVKTQAGTSFILVQTENLAAARKCGILVKKVFGTNSQVRIRKNKNQKSSAYLYSLAITEQETVTRMLKGLKLLDQGGPGQEDILVHPLLIQSGCCKRAFVRGLFLTTGSMSDPRKAYHFEIVLTTRKKAEQLKTIMSALDMDAKIVVRKKYFICYLKEGNQIVDMLGIMEAYLALMELENVRIYKEMRENVNRKVNCETANLNKTVSASVQQMNDIRYIRDTVGLSSLSESLEEIALARLEHPNMTLKELGKALSPPIGKSGVNHRLRKIGEIADQLRGN